MFDRTSNRCDQSTARTKSQCEFLGCKCRWVSGQSEGVVMSVRSSVLLSLIK